MLSLTGLQVILIYQQVSLSKAELDAFKSTSPGYRTRPDVAKISPDPEERYIVRELFLDLRYALIHQAPQGLHHGQLVGRQVGIEVIQVLEIDGVEFVHPLKIKEADSK